MSYLNHPYYTHQPFFTEVLKNTNGDVLECGCGEGSTAMIRSQLKGTSRKLVSIESDKAWLDKYIHLQNAEHDFYHVPADNNNTMETGMAWVRFVESTLADRQFDVVFIDSSPWLSRKCLFDYFKTRAKVVVIHDFDYFPNNGVIGKTTSHESYQNKEKITCDLTGEVENYRLYYPPYKYFAGPTGPPTLVCSSVLSSDEFTALMDAIDAAVPKYYP